MDVLVLLVAAVVVPVLGWWCVKFFIKLVFGALKIGAFAALALGAAYLTFTQAEFPAAPSAEAQEMVKFLGHRLSEKGGKPAEIKYQAAMAERTRTPRKQVRQEENPDSRYFLESIGLIT